MIGMNWHLCLKDAKSKLKIIPMPNDKAKLTIDSKGGATHVVIAYLLMVSIIKKNDQ